MGRDFFPLAGIWSIDLKPTPLRALCLVYIIRSEGVRGDPGILGYPNNSGFALWISPKKVPKKLCINVGYPNIKFLTPSLTKAFISVKNKVPRNEKREKQLCRDKNFSKTSYFWGVAQINLFAFQCNREYLVNFLLQGSYNVKSIFTATKNGSEVQVGCVFYVLRIL